MTRILTWVWHFFHGCPMEPWLLHALSSDHEGVSWTCPGCGRRVERSAGVLHYD